MRNARVNKIVVTGGAGFIGSHLVSALVERSFDVHVIDNFSGGKKRKVNQTATYHNSDIRNINEIKPVFAGASCVFHTAALPRVQVSIRDPKTTHEINVDGTFNVLLAAKETGVKRVVYSSSSSIYGNQDKYPLREDFEARPMSPYGLQKYIGELLCRTFSQVYGLETVSLRYFNVYGPNCDFDGPYALVIGRFLKQRVAGEPLTVVPPGTQSRDFTHVSDVVRANLLAMESPKVGKGEVINIGAGNDRTVAELASMIGGPTKFIEPRFEPQRTIADISRAKKLLGWEPEVSLEDGIRELRENLTLTS